MNKLTYWLKLKKFSSGKVKHLMLKDGDTIVLEHSNLRSMEEIENIQRSIKRVIPQDVSVLILCDGLTLKGVLRGKYENRG